MLHYTNYSSENISFSKIDISYHKRMIIIIIIKNDDTKTFLKKKYNTQVQKYRTKILLIRIYSAIPKLNIYY